MDESKFAEAAGEATSLEREHVDSDIEQEQEEGETEKQGEGEDDVGSSLPKSVNALLRYSRDQDGAPGLKEPGSPVRGFSSKTMSGHLRDFRHTIAEETRRVRLSQVSRVNMCASELHELRSFPNRLAPIVIVDYPPKDARAFGGCGSREKVGSSRNGEDCFRRQVILHLPRGAKAWASTKAPIPDSRSWNSRWRQYWRERTAASHLYRICTVV